MRFTSLLRMERIGIEHVGHSCNKIQIIRVSKEKVACPGQSRYKALERGHCVNRKIISLPPPVQAVHAGAYPSRSAAGLKALVALHVTLAALPDGCLSNVTHIHQA